ncbi:exodeoxyribonuclease V subunit gamma [Gephyromycinifex aptenodytis]|uniref:exodeoxyribonuclease V subunit gamma n=1 Tax=Gephyromycinifex aptenodytis TaxID=2716227 RepID=UPI001444CB11|nr:exodeoxyribonuclease V subunit gamma [Gephyromycinifex aptenodytis]
MSMHLHRGSRTESLAESLATLLGTSLPDPLATELVIVPARGVERWLTQRLAHRLGTGPRGSDGVCAGVEFRSPRSFIGLLLGAPEDDPWDPDRLVWPLLDLIDAQVDQPWLATLARHLGHGVPGEEGELRAGRRYAVARHLAGLFAGYALQRPALVTDWRLGRDTDGGGCPLDEDLRWQPELYRLLIEQVQVPPPDVRHAQTLARIADDPESIPVPPRLSMFGYTRLPRTEVELLGALAQSREVHLWLPQTSPAAWDTLAAACADGPVPRLQDQTATLLSHPLLASLGRDARELQRTLALIGATTPEPDSAPPQQVRDEPGEPQLLSWLQADLRADYLPTPQEREHRIVAAEDTSVQVHACHGPARQVEVLRDVLAGLLQDDPSLAPRDILVMCPDIETYAPLVQAAFGLGEVSSGATHPAHGFRVRLADRSLTVTNPLFTVTTSVLELAGGRVDVSSVLDLAASSPVRARFGFDDGDLEQVGRWVEEAAIRWGLDAEHRSRFKLQGYPQNTWRFGLDRLLLGVAMSEEEHRTIGTALPIDDIASADIDLLGRFVEFIDRLESTVHELERATGVLAWTQALRDGVAALTRVAPAEAWQSAQLEGELAAVAQAAGAATTLRLADVRVLLSQRLAGRPTRANFRTGSLTVCTMVPMRSVPHRVVALVGLDDGVFPRSGSIDGDDALARRPWTGERDVRSEDRQLFLDAIMTAQEHLVITYSGASEYDGHLMPPAVPLGELLDTLADTATAPEPAAAGPLDPAAPPGGTCPQDRMLQHVLTRHPLQSFDPRVVDKDNPFTFDPAALAGAVAAAAPRTAPPPFLSAPLAPREPGDIALNDLIAFFLHPARAFLRQRLGVGEFIEEDERVDAIPVELDGLGIWGVGDRLLRDARHGVEPAVARRAEQVRGLLPPAMLGLRTLDRVGSVVDALVQASGPLRQGDPRAVDILIDLPGGRRITGTVPEVYGTRILTVTYSSLRAKQRLRSWIPLVALTAARPDLEWTSHVIARQGSRATHLEAGPLAPGHALAVLSDLVDMYDRGMNEPLPLPVETGYAFAEAARRVANGEQIRPRDVAGKTWVTPPKPDAIPGEADDRHHVRVYGPNAPLTVLLERPRPDESWNTAGTRLGQYALRLWQPILDAQRRGRV